MSIETPLLTSVDGDILLLVLNRPQVRNAVNADLAHAVSRALNEFDACADLRVAVITGAGGTFCAGMDLRAFAAGESARVGNHGFMGLTNRQLAKPLIAAVEGAAMGGGFEVALACDLLVCARSARLGLSEVKRGLAATGGGLLRLPRRVPWNLAMEMALTGEPIDGQRASDIGLANRLTEPGGALRQAMELARLVARNAPLAVAASKEIIHHQQDWPIDEAFERQDSWDQRLKASDDAREGARAFMEKRAAVWVGR
jgi:enoyl-CoA hydratase